LKCLQILVFLSALSVLVVSSAAANSRYPSPNIFLNFISLIFPLYEKLTELRLRGMDSRDR
jgi:hypothetical protein